MRTNHRRGIAYGLTAGALAVALACTGCSGTAQNGPSAQNSSAASNVETSNVAVNNGNANAATNGSQGESSSVASSAANANAAANQNASAGGEDGSAKSANSNTTTAIANSNAKEAKGTLPDGWYLTSLTGTEGTSNISAASFSDGTWTLTGTLTRGETEDALYGDDNQGEVGPGTWNLKVSKDATFEAGSNPKAADRSAVESTIASLNGLGLVLHVEGGEVTYARLAS